MGKHTHIIASNALRRILTGVDLAGLEYLVVIRLLFDTAARRDMTWRDVISVVASDLMNQLPNARVPANEPVSNHIVMHNMMQNVACIYKLGINNCAANFEHFHSRTC